MGHYTSSVVGPQKGDRIVIEPLSVLRLHDVIVNEAGFIRTMNRIYRGQVGIDFASAGAKSLKLDDIKPIKGGVPVFQNGTTSEHKAIVSNRNPDSLFNVFFVGDMVDMSLSASPADFLGLTSFSDHSSLITKIARKISGAPGRCCPLRDRQQRDNKVVIDFGVVIAHEAGHALDQEDIDDEARKDQLMFGVSESRRTGTNIPSQSAHEMLQSALKFPP